MIVQKNITIINKSAIPVGKVKGTYTFLRDTGKTLAKDKAISITTTDAAEAKKIQNRWRAYFKDWSHTKKEVKDDTITIYLWLEK